MTEDGVVWVVGRQPAQPDEEWEFMGVFTTEELAVAACTTRRDFVGRTVLNQRAPEDKLVWPDAYYPIDGASVDPHEDADG